MNEYMKTNAEELAAEEQFFTPEDKAETAPQKKEQGKMNRGLSEVLRGEVNAMLEKYPHWRDKLHRGESLPREVVTACAKEGVTLRAAMAEYELEQAKREIERLHRENVVLRQNANAAAKAPVKGAAFGGAETKGKDPFLEGLLSED